MSVRSSPSAAERPRMNVHTRLIGTPLAWGSPEHFVPATLLLLDFVSGSELRDSADDTL